MFYKVPTLNFFWEIPRKATVIEPLFRNGVDIMPAILQRKDFFTDIFDEIRWGIIKLLVFKSRSEVMMK